MELNIEHGIILYMKILKIIFITLGSIFLIVLLCLAYLWIFDPLGIKNIIKTDISPVSVIKTLTGNSVIEIDNIDKNPLLNEQQESQLESMGIEPADLPTEITADMKVCFVEKLGTVRAAEIVSGVAPTAVDFIKASSCLGTN